MYETDSLQDLEMRLSEQLGDHSNVQGAIQEAEAELELRRV